VPPGTCWFSASVTECKTEGVVGSTADDGTALISSRPANGNGRLTNGGIIVEGRLCHSCWRGPPVGPGRGRTTRTYLPLTQVRAGDSTRTYFL
jgi:hypothetical protein